MKPEVNFRLDFTFPTTKVCLLSFLYMHYSSCSSWDTDYYGKVGEGLLNGKETGKDATNMSSCSLLFL